MVATPEKRNAQNSVSHQHQGAQTSRGRLQRSSLRGPLEWIECYSHALPCSYPKQASPYPVWATLAGDHWDQQKSTSTPWGATDWMTSTIKNGVPFLGVILFERVQRRTPVTLQKINPEHHAQKHIPQQKDDLLVVKKGCLSQRVNIGKFDPNISSPASVSTLYRFPLLILPKLSGQTFRWTQMHWWVKFSPESFVRICLWVFSPLNCDIPRSKKQHLQWGYLWCEFHAEIDVPLIQYAVYTVYCSCIGTQIYVQTLGSVE